MNIGDGTLWERWVTMRRAGIISERLWEGFRAGYLDKRAGNDPLRTALAAEDSAYRCGYYNGWYQHGA